MAARLSEPGSASGFAVSWRAEWRHLRHGGWDLAFITVLPLAMLVVLACLFSRGGMRELPIAVVDADRSGDSRLLARQIDASAGVAVASQPATLEQAFSQLRALQVFAVVYVPRDFSRQMRRGQSIEVIDYYNASYLASGQSAMRDIADAVNAANARLLAEHLGTQVGPSKLRPAPVAVQSQVLFNPARSYALFLLPLAFAAVLSLGAALAMTAALGREVRDGTLRDWLGAHPLAAILGKLAPYVLLFSLYGLLAAVWVAHAHGDGVAGSLVLLALGQLLLNLAGAGIALLFVGLQRDMGSALSLVGLSVGASLAFSGATFTTLEGPLFTRVWSAMLPLTAYIKLQMQQLLVGSPWTVSLAPLGTLLLIAAVSGAVGYLGLMKSARQPAQGRAG